MLSSFHFVHAADIHLDSPLKGLSGEEHDQNAVKRIRSATREALEKLVSYVIEQKCCFLVIAGDLYDGDWKDFQTGLFFIKQMKRLESKSIPVFMIFGNHDAESKITRQLSLPGNVTVFSAKKPETHKLEQYKVALHGQGFKMREINENLARNYPGPILGYFNIGILHSGLEGKSEHANYAPCTLDELVHKGYDYWALGHIHKQEILYQEPHVVYSGNLQGRHIQETGPKGAFLVSIENDSVQDITPFYVDVVRWSLIQVSVEGCSEKQEVFDRIREEIEEAVTVEADGRLLACRIELQGQTPAHYQLLTSIDELLAEATAAALVQGEEAAWIERIKINTQHPDSSSIDDMQDALGELMQSFDGAADDPAVLEEMEREFNEFVGKLPSEIRNQTEDPVLKAVLDQDYSGLIQEAKSYVLAQVLRKAQ